MSLLQVGPPVIVLISLLNIGRSKVQRDYDQSAALERGLLELPIVTLDTLSLQGEWHNLLKPTLDAMWNAYEYAFSPNFNEGKWTARQS
jgi:hypothetical protein